MAKKLKKKEIDNELLETIYQLEADWKQIQSIMKRSIEPTPRGSLQESIAQAKYIFLLREARYRNLSALR